MTHDWRKGLFMKIQLKDGTLCLMEATQTIPKGTKILSTPEPLQYFRETIDEKSYTFNPHCSCWTEEAKIDHTSACTYLETRKGFEARGSKPSKRGIKNLVGVDSLIKADGTVETLKTGG